MSPEPSSPSVFVKEASRRRPQIVGLPTGIAAFVGTSGAGPVGSALRVGSLGEFEHEFGSLTADGTLGFAVRDYFANGGRRAWIVRIVETSGSAVEAALAKLVDEDEWDVLCLPEQRPPASASGRSEALAFALAACEKHQRFLVLDSPSDWAGVQEALASRSDLGASRNAAVYFPWLRQPNPLAGGVEESFPPCGAVAGVIARTDATRGVWKAPAGLEAQVRGVTGLALALDSADLEALNPQTINALHSTSQAGPVVWGARTLAGGGNGDPEWRYVPVRRTALYLQRSIEAGTAWVVFEPNDEPLWTALRAAVESFMEGLLRAGALAGSRARDAYFVRCGRDTTTQADIDAGRVNLQLGFAPLKPAEFIVLGFTFAVGRESAGPRPPIRQRRAALTLFAGPSGSGQIRAARKLARGKGRSLLRVRPDDVLAKYIGETEKNLDALFERAAEEKAILFFDEADALFGKRTEVEDSHDRYANLEVSYLLERMKDFQGIVIVSVESVAGAPRKLRRRCKHCLEFPPRR